jgi:YidC/Oxa1 family membrane protein insertase
MSTILNPIYFAVSWVIVTLHDLLGFIVGKSAHESLKWSLAIIGLVVLIRIILIPLFVKQIKSQRALTALQPKMKEIQKRYKDDRQKQSEEMMKLYKEHKTNPLSSCLPIIAQAPIFFSLFTVLNGIAHNHPHGVFNKIVNGVNVGTDAFKSAQTAKFFGASLSDSFLNTHVTSTKLVTVALILFMSATTFTTQRQLMVKGMPKNDGSNDMMAQQQKIMLYVFPVIFAVSGVNFPVGVLIYWGTTNLWTFGQQYYVIKRNPTPGSPAYIELMQKREAKGIVNPDSSGTTQTLDSSSDSHPENSTQNPQSPQRKQPKKRKPKK